MFLFIDAGSGADSGDSGIQIHLMFLFILLDDAESVEFKYISCSYLSTNKAIAGASTAIQIHLMFLFIDRWRLLLPADLVFKYISCSYLS